MLCEVEFHHPVKNVHQYNNYYYQIQQHYNIAELYNYVINNIITAVQIYVTLIEQIHNK